MRAGPRANRAAKDRHGVTIDNRTATVEQLMDVDTVFAGSPDDVVQQIRAFNNRMGGIGHLLVFGQGGHLSHADTVENIRLFGREVAPRLADLHAEPERTAAE